MKNQNQDQDQDQDQDEEVKYTMEEKYTIDKFIKEFMSINPYVLFVQNKDFLNESIKNRSLGKTFEFKDLLQPLNGKSLYWLDYKGFKETIYQDKKNNLFLKVLTKDNRYFSLNKIDGDVEKDYYQEDYRKTVNITYRNSSYKEITNNSNKEKPDKITVTITRPQTIFLIIIYDFLTLDEISQCYLNHFIPCGMTTNSCMVDSLYHTPYDFTLHDIFHGNNYLNYCIFRNNLFFNSFLDFELLKKFYYFYKNTYADKVNELYQLDIMYFLVIHESFGGCFPYYFMDLGPNVRKEEYIKARFYSEFYDRIMDETDLLPLIPEKVYSDFKGDEEEDKIEEYMNKCLETYFDALRKFQTDQGIINTETNGLIVKTETKGGGATRRRRKKKRTVKRRKHASRKRKTYKSKKQRRTRR